MRLWTIHPKYLDRAGLVALWREGLLAQKVLEGRTKGYKHHPQLIKFKNSDSPLNSIRRYLVEVFKEGTRRGYKFERSRIGRVSGKSAKMPVTQKEIKFEFAHLLKKLKRRAPEKYEVVKKVKRVMMNPRFRAAR
jgi:hypothetical protein